MSSSVSARSPLAPAGPSSFATLAQRDGEQAPEEFSWKTHRSVLAPIYKTIKLGGFLRILRIRHPQDIKDVEFSWPIGMPLCRSLDKGLWEVRSNITHGRIARVIFYVSGGEMILLHGFVKKSQRTPDNEKNLAMKRKKEHERHG